MAPKGKGAAKGATKKKKEEVAAPVMAAIPMAEEEDFYREPVKRIVRPPNQLDLTDEQLNEEITRVITANDPNIPNNVTKYNYKDRSFKQDPEGPMDHLAFHLQINCSLYFHILSI